MRGIDNDHPGTVGVWRKSGRCVGGDCVQVRLNGNRVEVRDSKLGDDSPVLTFDERAWRLTLSAVVHYDYPPGTLTGPDGVTWQRDGVELRFTWAEFDAFVAGVKDGDFDADRLAAAASNPSLEPPGLPAPLTTEPQSFLADPERRESLFQSDDEPDQKG